MDNPMYLFEYLHNNPVEGIKCYWITKDKNLYLRLKKEGKNALYYFSIRGFWISFRAGVSFLANGYSDLNKLAAIHSFLVHLWHGTPIKKIHFDAELENSFYSFGILNKPLTYLCVKTTEYLNNQIDLFFVSSDFELERMSKAFRISKEVFQVAGVPRYDIIEGKENSNLGIENVFEPYNKTNGKVIVYAPTWRDSGWAEEQKMDFLEEFNSFLERHNSYFFIKRHPLTSREEVLNWNFRESDRIIIVENDKDINGLYQFIDIIITDFSSVMFDFGILKKPVLFFLTDLEKYSQNRGFYDDIEEYSGGRINHNWKELVNSLAAVEEMSDFVQHPHYEYILNHNFGNVRETIIASVINKTEHA